MLMSFLFKYACDYHKFIPEEIAWSIYQDVYKEACLLLKNSK